ncbi:MAG: peptidoglycan DD-metalloendopeptidase family protein [Pseudomonadota bacterium]
MGRIWTAWPARSNLVVMVVGAFLLAACSTRWDHTPQDAHVVRSGETLYTIAWRYGADPRNLARWNRLGDGSLIYPGQVIRLRPPSGSAAAQVQTGSRPLPEVRSEPPPSHWSWPTRGAIQVDFGGRPGSGTGVLIGGKLGQPVVAAAAGRVVYSGGGLAGYGQLIIVKHNDTYLSAYGHNASLLVKQGESVRKGQRIATLGEGPGRQPRLHFEIRKNGKPVNPRQCLPAR